MTQYQIHVRTEEVLKAWQKETEHYRAVPLLCIAGVTGEGGQFPVGTHFTLNCQGRTQGEVLELLRNTVTAMEAQIS